MKYRNKIIKALILTPFICLCAVNAYPIQPIDSLSVEAGIRSGKLSSGLSYYLKQVPDVSDKIYTSLVVKVGHNHQGPGEFEFAHIVEHLGLSAGKNISFQKSSQLFDDIGLQLGEFNGHTWNDYTEFKMVLPGNNNKATKAALLFFEDIIYNLELTHQNIEKERTAVFNEKNRGTFTPKSFLRYLERKLGGHEVMLLEEGNLHLTSFKPETLIRFYKKWYQPENMAIVMVGPIDSIDDLEVEIQRRFAKPAPDVDKSRSKNRIQPSFPKGPQFLKRPFPHQAERPERMMAILSFFSRAQPKEEKNHFEGLKAELKKDLFVQLMNSRHKVRQEAYNVDFSVRTEIAETPHALKSDLWFTGNFKEESLKKIIRDFVEVEQNGFTSDEFNDGKHSIMKTSVNQDTLSNFYWKNEIISHFVKGKALPGNKKKLEKSIIQNLTLEEFNEQVKEFLKNLPDDMTLAAHPGHPLLFYTEKEIRTLFSYYDDIPNKPYPGQQTPPALIDSLSLLGLKETSYKEIETEIPGGKAYELENGLNVILKSSLEPNGEKVEKNMIYFHGIGKMGVSHFSEEDFFTAMNVPAIVRNSGVGDLDKFEVERFLTENEFNGHVRPYIEYHEGGIKGSASMEDIETALQLTHLYITDPHFTEDAFQDWKRNEAESLAIFQDINREDFLNYIVDSIGPREMFPKGTEALEGLEEVDFKRAQIIFRQLFHKPRDLTFLFTGNFEEQEILNLCRKYLGNLPLSENTQINSDSWIQHEAPDQHSLTIVPSTKPMELAKVRLVYKPQEDIPDFNWKEEIKVEVLRRSLAALLMRRLRFESATGGIYQVGVGRYNSERKKDHQMFIVFDCKPEDTNRLITESQGVVSSLIKTGINEHLYKTIQTILLKSYDEPESPQTGLKKMYALEVHGRPWVTKADKREYLKSLTLQDILSAAQNYLYSDPLKFVMVPKK